MTPTKPLKVAVQGVEGCFHDAAAHDCFASRELDIKGCDTFADLFDALDADPSMLGLAAFENTIAGSIQGNYELLRRADLRIVGEHKMRISHTLCALPGTRLEDITEVHSHPMALMQCEAWLRRHPRMKMVEDFDTAGSARHIARNRIAGHAAVCSRYAAELYGLQILADGIETVKQNYTRFLVLAHPGADLPLHEGKVDKASVVFTLPHTRGALSKVLAILAFYDIDLSKIQSAPIVGRCWEYRFYVDLTFDDPLRYRSAIDAVMPLISDFKLMGEYHGVDEPDQISSI